MKLYYAPGACSLASHLALIEAGLSFSIDKTDVRNRKTSTGEDFLALTGGWRGSGRSLVVQAWLLPPNVHGF